MERKEFLKLIGISGTSFMFSGLTTPTLNFTYDLQSIVIYDNYIKGSNFYRKNFEGLQLSEGREIVLERDIENIHDRFAVKVMVDGMQVGFLPAYENIVIANMMDKGVQLKATISKLSPNTSSATTGYSRVVAVKIETQLMVPANKIISTNLTNQPADDVEDVYRKGYEVEVEQLTKNTRL